MIRKPAFNLNAEIISFDERRPNPWPPITVPIRCLAKLTAQRIPLLSQKTENHPICEED